MPYSFGVDFFRHSRPSAERLFGSAWAPPLSLCALWALCVYTLLCQKLFFNANFYIIKISEKENNATYVSAEKEALISVPLKARAERGELAEIGEIETAYQNTAVPFDWQRPDLLCPAPSWLAKGSAPRQTSPKGWREMIDTHL